MRNVERDMISFLRVTFRRNGNENDKQKVSNEWLRNFATEGK